MVGAREQPLTHRHPPQDPGVWVGERPPSPQDPGGGGGGNSTPTPRSWGSSPPPTRKLMGGSWWALPSPHPRGSPAYLLNCWGEAGSVRPLWRGMGRTGVYHLIEKCVYHLIEKSWPKLSENSVFYHQIDVVPNWQTNCFRHLRKLKLDNSFCTVP